MVGSSCFSVFDGWSGVAGSVDESLSSLLPHDTANIISSDINNAFVFIVIFEMLDKNRGRPNCILGNLHFMLLVID
jgi:hypothetical protein